MNITVNVNGANVIYNGEKIEFYYTKIHEGVKIDGIDYKWMKDLPDKYTNITNELMKAYHHYRLIDLKLDNHLNPLFK